MPVLGASAGSELAVRVVATGCRCCIPVLAVRVVERGCRVLGAGAGCCELAVRVVETGCRCWVPVLAVRVVERGCWCWVLVLDVRVAETGCRCWGADAGCAPGGTGFLESWRTAGQLTFGASMVAHAFILKLWMWLFMELCVNICMP